MNEIIKNAALRILPQDSLNTRIKIIQQMFDKIMQANKWKVDENDDGLVKRGDEVIGLAVDARNAERFIVAHNLLQRCN